jgi:hypothetical protein
VSIYLVGNTALIGTGVPGAYVGATSDRGMTMPIMLVILIPLAILAAVVLVYELKRRRRAADAVDMASRVRAVRNSTETRHGVTPPGGGPS